MVPGLFFELHFCKELRSMEIRLVCMDRSPGDVMRLAEGRACLVEVAAGGLQICPGLVFVHKESGYRNHEGDMPIVVRIGRTLVVAAAVMLLTFFVVMTAVVFFTLFIVMAAMVLLTLFLIVVVTAVVLTALLLIVMVTAVVLLTLFLVVMMAAVMAMLPGDDLVERLIAH
jgi:hypothetical protein